MSEAVDQIERVETFQDPTTETGLDPRRERFAQEYVNGPYSGNATRSAIAAGAGETYLSSSQAGSKMLREKGVRARIKQLMAEQAERLIVTDERIIAEYAKLAFSDLGEAVDFNTDGTPAVKPSRDIPAHARQALKKVKMTRRSIMGSILEEKVEYELHDKKGALDTLAKHRGLLADEQPGTTVQVFLIEVPPRLDQASWGEKYRKLGGG